MHNRSSHVEETIARINPKFGYLYHVVTNYNNSSCILMYEDKEHGITRIVFRGRPVLENEEVMRSPLVALRPDGRKLAVCRGLPGDCIFMFGQDGIEQTYHNPDGLITGNMEWLPGNRLAWKGYVEEESHTNETDGDSFTTRHAITTTWHYFMDGSKTDRVQFMSMLSVTGRHITKIREDGLRYMMRDDGSKYGYHEDCCDSLMCSCNRSWKSEEKIQAAETLPDSSGVHVRFAGQTGPRFSGIAPVGLAPRNFSYNSDRSRVAYIGIIRTSTANTLAWVGHQLFGKMGSKILDHPLTGWPAAILFNPYFGPGHIYFEKLSKRYIIVNHDHVWKRILRRPPTAHFFTSFDQLAIVCGDGSSERMFVDELPGPKFDAILNPRYLEQEGKICYAARRGDKILRVTA